jgi:hypothetical protein
MRAATAILVALLVVMASGDAWPVGAQEQVVSVFFSKSPESDADFSLVLPVSRVSPTSGVARFALNQLIAGPSPDERAAGYFSELGSMLQGDSWCDGDFWLSLVDGVLTVQFCRVVASAGVGQDARARSQLEATLRQFSTIRDVRLLTREGDCLFDMSGRNLCLGPR